MSITAEDVVLVHDTHRAMGEQPWLPHSGHVLRRKARCCPEKNLQKCSSWTVTDTASQNPALQDSGAMIQEQDSGAMHRRGFLGLGGDLALKQKQ